jgi:HPt (histidine-containing phosphotransfer) domain-containing protein
MSEFNAAMDVLAKRFLVRCGDDLAKLKELSADSADKQSEIRHIVHRMSGSAGIFGHDAIGMLAAQVDDDIVDGRPVGATTLPVLIEALTSLLDTPHSKGD